MRAAPVLCSREHERLLGVKAKGSCGLQDIPDGEAAVMLAAEDSQLVPGSCSRQACPACSPTLLVTFKSLTATAMESAPSAPTRSPPGSSWAPVSEIPAGAASPIWSSGPAAGSADACRPAPLAECCIQCWDSAGALRTGRCRAEPPLPSPSGLPSSPLSSQLLARQPLLACPPSWVDELLRGIFTVPGMQTGELLARSAALRLPIPPGAAGGLSCISQDDRPALPA
mmetsp:Transcript_30701/g.86789  ORF Transcript_30701/g.86789 Transcript_30701/m.86789 type:complete len:227 (+) Transcript_30701:1403-2083(+)